MYIYMQCWFVCVYVCSELFKDYIYKCNCREYMYIFCKCIYNGFHILVSGEMGEIIGATANHFCVVLLSIQLIHTKYKHIYIHATYAHRRTVMLNAICFIYIGIFVLTCVQNTFRGGTLLLYYTKCFFLLFLHNQSTSGIRYFVLRRVHKHWIDYNLTIQIKTALPMCVWGSFN